MLQKQEICVKLYNHPAPEVIFHLTEIGPSEQSCLLESGYQAADWTIILTLLLGWQNNLFFPSFSFGFTRMRHYRPLWANHPVY